MSTLLLILQLVPVLIQTIKAIEELIPEGGKGKEKLALVEQIMTTSYDGVAKIWPVMQGVISAIVSTCNATGAFKKD